MTRLVILLALLLLSSCSSRQRELADGGVGVSTDVNRGTSMGAFSAEPVAPQHIERVRKGLVRTFERVTRQLVKATTTPPETVLPPFQESERCRSSKRFPPRGCTRLVAARDITKPADYIFIEKKNRRLSLFRKRKLVARYAISLSRKWRYKKERAGDIRTPVGVYFASGKNPRSSFYKSIGVSYPNAGDRRRAAQKGVRPGCCIEIHGISPYSDETNVRNLGDWTWGCIALSNFDMDQVFTLVPEGIPILIVYE